MYSVFDPPLPPWHRRKQSKQSKQPTEGEDCAPPPATYCRPALFVAIVDRFV